jgi:hypothetical protein
LNIRVYFSISSLFLGTYLSLHQTLASALVELWQQRFPDEYFMISATIVHMRYNILPEARIYAAHYVVRPGLRKREFR